MSAGVYLHIPFCRSRCSYCDFATDVYRDSGAVERYVEALCAEIDRESPRLHDGIPPAYAGGSDSCDTIYFGGGTPSLLEAKQVEKILEQINARFDI